MPTEDVHIDTILSLPQQQIEPIPPPPPTKPQRRIQTWWNEERIEKLTRLWNENLLSAGQIAQEMGAKTRSVIIGKAFRLRLGSKRSFGEQLAEQRTGQPRAVKVARSTKMENRKPILPVAAKEPPSNDPIGLMTLDNGHCRYIVGSSDNGLALYCGAEKVYGSYCAYHADLCYNVRTASG